MQDRYAGDVGDFLKLGLLRGLTAPDDLHPGLSLGVLWYLTPDESHDDDGKHVAYVDPTTPIGRSLERLDPDLHRRLATMLLIERSVAELERSGRVVSIKLPWQALSTRAAWSSACQPRASSMSRNADLRRRVHDGELCIASPYAPNAPFRAGNAMGRNKIVYALSRVTFVVASDQDQGGTWAGAKEARDRRYANVAVWAGAGAKGGNHALIRRGATAVTDLEQLFEIDTTLTPPPLQHSLF